MDLLAMRLKLDRTECLSGESAFFDIEIQNVTQAPMEIPDLNPLNRSVKLLIGDLSQGREPQHVAHQLSPRERDGLHEHEWPENPTTMRLAPKQTVTLRGDTLNWFGILPPGTYPITARYQGGLLLAEAPAATLRVLPSLPQSFGAGRIGLQGLDAPLTATWTHRAQPEPVVFYQQQSPFLPRNVRHAIRMEAARDAVAIGAACVPSTEVETGHLYWVDRKGRLMVAPMDVKGGRAGKPCAVKTPLRCQPLPSGLSMPDGTLMLPVTDAARQHLVVLHIRPDGTAEPYELPLGEVQPVGAFACFWEGAQRLHLAWAKPNGRQLQYAMLPLTELEAGFAVRTAYVSTEAIIGVDACLDQKAGLTGLPYFKHQVPPDRAEGSFEAQPPKVVLWCAVRKVASIGCLRITLPEGAAQAVTSFPSAQAADLRILSSGVTLENQWALLLADAAGKLHYASTVRRAMLPLASLLPEPPSADNFPALLAAGRGAVAPWVYLQYLRPGQPIQHLRVEPKDEPDPVEKKSKPADSEEEGS